MRAYDCFLRGKAALYSASDASGLARAREFFDRAVAADPDFAQPYNFLVRVENTMAKYAPGSAAVASMRQRAWELARKAESLDDRDPHTHIALAWCHI